MKRVTSDHFAHPLTAAEGGGGGEQADGGGGDVVVDDDDDDDDDVSVANLALVLLPRLHLFCSQV